MITAAELIELLSGLPPETPVLTSGYEGGLTPCTVCVEQVQELARGDDAAYLGAYELAEEAQRQAAQDPRGWISMVGVPELVGEPVTAVIIAREGR